MEVKHTPGPWFIHDGIMPAPDKNGEVGTYGIINMEAHEHNVKVIGSVFPYAGKNYPSKEEAHANAKLVSAAPDMLSALQAAIALSDKTLKESGANYRTEECQAVYDQAKAAIEKATA